VSSTQITGNRAIHGGGGIYDDGTEATVTLTDSSPVGNKPDTCEPRGSLTGCTG
jgi:predicted outer membrane repeat protein